MKLMQFVGFLPAKHLPEDTLHVIEGVGVFARDEAKWVEDRVAAMFIGGGEFVEALEKEAEVVKDKVTAAVKDKVAGKPAETPAPPVQAPKGDS